MSYLTGERLSGELAKVSHGATIVLESRFIAKSNPGPDLSAKTLAGLHTIEQAVEDIVYFSQNVRPFLHLNR